jgi:hypothetical protein
MPGRQGFANARNVMIVGGRYREEYQPLRNRDRVYRWWHKSTLDVCHHPRHFSHYLVCGLAFSHHMAGDQGPGRMRTEAAIAIPTVTILSCLAPGSQDISSPFFCFFCMGRHMSSFAPHRSLLGAWPNDWQIPGLRRGGGTSFSFLT